MREKNNRLVSIIIPVFNEKDTVAEVIAETGRLPLEKEIIAVDDGSDDGTADILSRLAREVRGVHVISSPVNRGKGWAVRRGIAASRGEIIAVQDADLEYPPEQIVGLVNELVRDGSAAAVFGSRLLGRNPISYHRYYWGGRFLTLIVNVLCRSRLTDVTTGHKVFHRSVFNDMILSSDGFEIEIEITVKLLKRKLRITEVPIRYVPRTFAQGKKISWQDGMKGIITGVYAAVGERAEISRSG